jgi:hypothetical protein
LHRNYGIALWNLSSDFSGFLRQLKTSLLCENTHIIFISFAVIPQTRHSASFSTTLTAIMDDVRIIISQESFIESSMAKETEIDLIVLFWLPLVKIPFQNVTCILFSHSFPCYL